MRATLAGLADAEPLLNLPALLYWTTIEVVRPVAANAAVALCGNRFSLPPGLTTVELTLRQRLNSGTLDVHSPAATLLVSHRRDRAGAGTIVRFTAHYDLSEAAELAAFATARPCDRAGEPATGRCGARRSRPSARTRGQRRHR